MAIAQNIPTHYNYEPDLAGSFDWNAWLDTIVAMTDPPSVISISYAGNEPDVPALAYFNSLAIILAVRGLTLIAASGDHGAHSSGSCEYAPLFPASSQYVIAVGATMGPESYREEIVCSSGQGSSITSGGGFSNVEPVPSWQQSFVDNYFNNVVGTTNQPVSGYSITGRGYPDVSLLGNHYLVVINHSFYIMDGSSASTPVFAGMVALVNAARRQIGLPSLGWLNPLLYANANSGVFNDIVTGNNKCGASFSVTRCTCSEGFTATTGWDPASGLGSINFQNFLSTFTSIPPTVSPTSSPTAVPTASLTFKPTTAKPTSKPSLKPSPKRTSKPTYKPTTKRTVKPSVRPT
jgi:tripeptidyl-peptidase-1